MFDSLKIGGISQGVVSNRKQGIFSQKGEVYYVRIQMIKSHQRNKRKSHFGLLFKSVHLGKEFDAEVEQRKHFIYL